MVPSSISSFRGWEKKGKSNTCLWIHLLVLYFLGSLLATSCILSDKAGNREVTLLASKEAALAKKSSYTCAFFAKDYMGKV